MTTITLDFSVSYRAITDTDILPILVRDPFGWDGNGEPEAAVTLVGDDGGITHIRARDGTDGLPAFFIDHSPNSNQFDLINFVTETVLRFQVPVDAAPIWANYVDTLYTGQAQIDQYYIDSSDYFTALDTWVGYVMTHEFRASSAAYSDKAGALGQFTSSAALIIDDFTTAPQFFAVNITGSAFNDNFSGGDLNDTLHGAAGDDVIQGDGGDDSVFGGGGGDILDGKSGADTVNGDAGADLVVGDIGNDDLFGGVGNDSLYGGDGNDGLFGGGGGDLMSGGTGNDLINGDGGADQIFGNNGADSLIGGAENDTINGGVGADTIYGGTGDDNLLGEGDNDSLTGGAGSDVLQGGAGKDTLTGGTEADFFRFDLTGAANADKITDFDHAIDRIWLGAATFAGVHAAVDVGEFRLGTAAQDGDDRIIYDPASGRLFYDPDGTRHGALSAPQQLFAIITNHAPLTFDDFLVV